MSTSDLIQKCDKCLALCGSRVGDCHVHGWLQSDPKGTLQNTMESAQSSWMCQHCATRWIRRQMKLSGAVRWTETRVVSVREPNLTTNGIFPGLKK